MSYYEVFLSDNDNEPVSIFEPDKKEMALLNATVSLAIREAGSFDFSIPPHHVFADSIKPYGSTIEVRENGKTIFFGRPLPPTTDFWGNKTYHCEGALAFLTDVVLPPMGFLSEMTVGELLEATIDEYNKHQTRADREFRYSASGFPNVTIYEPDDWNYQTALDYIRNYLFQFCGGFFYAEWDGTEILLKWKSELTEKNDQPVELGLNLIEMMRTGKSFYTAAIARGGQNTDGVEAHMMTPKYASNALRNEYGTIVAYLEHPETTAVDALEAYCETFLEEQQFNGSVLEITAADLSLQEDNVYEEFRLEQLIHVTSRPQGIDATLPITRLEIDINSAAKRAVIGTLDVPPLTVSTQQIRVQAEKKSKEIAKKTVDKDNAKAKPTTIKGSDGNDYGLDVDAGGNVIAVKVLNRIAFTRSVILYLSGQTFNHNSYVVTGYYGDGQEIDVTQDCSYSIQDGYVFNGTDDPRELVAQYDLLGARTLTASTKIRVQQSEITTTKIRLTVQGTVDGRDLVYSSRRNWHGTFGYTLEVMRSDGRPFKVLVANLENDISSSSSSTRTGFVVYIDNSLPTSTKFIFSGSYNYYAVGLRGDDDISPEIRSSNGEQERPATTLENMYDILTHMRRYYLGGLYYISGCIDNTQSGIIWIIAFDGTLGFPYDDPTNYVVKSTITNIAVD